MLISLLLLPIFGIFFLLFIPRKHNLLIKKVSLFFSLSCFFYSLLLFLFFDQSTSKFQYLEFIEWFPVYNMHFFLGLDGISLFLVILSTLLINFCILTSWNSIVFNIKEYLICFLLIDTFLVIVFRRNLT